MTERITVGLISDTHGMLRPEALAMMRGCDLIIHAGDVGRPKILAELARLAPVTAVRGNVDKGEWAEKLPHTGVLQAGGATIWVLHDLADIDLDPAAAGFQAVISGHSHKPYFLWRNGVLYVNPGSAGPRRFSLPISIGRLYVEHGKVSVELTTLEPSP